MKIIIKVIYIILLFILFSCEEEDKKVRLDETFVLQYGETKMLDGQDQFAISFKSLLGDSRCPANAICVWAGQARVKIEISEGYEMLKRELTIGTILENQTSKINTGHYSIELLKVIPYPETGGGEPKESDYAIQLLISSN